MINDDEEFEEENITTKDVGEVPAEVLASEAAPVAPVFVRMAKGEHHITVNTSNKALFNRLLKGGWTVMENPPEGIMGNLQSRIKVKPAALKNEDS